MAGSVGTDFHGDNLARASPHGHEPASRGPPGMSLARTAARSPSREGPNTPTPHRPQVRMSPCASPRITGSGAQSRNGHTSPGEGLPPSARRTGRRPVLLRNLTWPAPLSLRPPMVKCYASQHIPPRTSPGIDGMECGIPCGIASALWPPKEEAERCLELRLSPPPAPLRDDPVGEGTRSASGPTPRVVPTSGIGLPLTMLAPVASQLREF